MQDGTALVNAGNPTARCQKCPMEQRTSIYMYVCIIQALVITNYKRTRSHEYHYKFHDWAIPVQLIRVHPYGGN